jgi:hypothetical protein
VTGCKRQGCQSDEHCEAGTVCHAGKCIPGDTVDRYRKAGIGMLVPGIILMTAGAALIPTGFIMYNKTRYCYDTILGRACSHDRSMTEYTLYQVFVGLGLISLGGGIALTIIGAIKLRRSREIQGLASLPVEPFFAPAPGGGVIGLGGRF